MNIVTATMAKTIPINLFRVVGTKSKLTTDSNSSSKRRHQLLQQNYEKYSRSSKQCQ
jgi:hypothetical protein